LILLYTNKSMKPLKVESRYRLNKKLFIEFLRNYTSNLKKFRSKMMINKINLRFVLSLFLLISIFTVSVPQTDYAQTAPQSQLSSDLQSRLAAIEQKVDARRKELGVPGMSLAIVKDGEVIFAKGFGYKDFTKQIPVTADTQFAIGSATKAFTALSVLMTQDEGKLSLDDSPKKYLSYFKINDAEIDKNITIRDLLSHSSGLNRTDLGWITGKLNREEMIKVMGEAKPVAKLREKFLYQNIMFAAAGEIVAKAQKQPWEKFVAERIFKPLGMKNSTMAVKKMQKAKDYSLGYDYNFDTKETRTLPIRNIDEIAPAGSINSSAKDMAKWLRFVLSRGKASDKRLISEKSFEEWTKPQMKISPNGKFSYGLGWFLQEWNGLKVVQHGGNIDGFNSLVAMIPEKKLGFVMLTNVSGSSLGGEMMPIVWENMLNNPNAAAIQVAVNDLEKEAGKYRFEAAGFDVEIKMQGGKLIAVVPGQPLYTLESVGTRRYKLSGAPDGFFVTFKEGELYLEQPQGNYTLPRVKFDGNISVTKSSTTAKELVGKYESETAKGRLLEISESGDKIMLNIESQPPYELKDKDKDTFSLSPLPDTYSLKVRRDAAGGKITAVVIIQPEGEFGFKALGATAADDKSNAVNLTVDALLAKTIDALGGEANWRKLTSRVTKFDVNFENQGIRGAGTSFEKAANMAATELTLTALDKPIATIRDYFDGTNGGETTTFSPDEIYTGMRLEDVKLESDFYGLANWKTTLKKAEIKGVEKVGDEETYIVKFMPEKASETTYYISTKTFLPIKKTSVIVSSTSKQKTPVSETFADYRAVDGVMLPFKITSINPGMGLVVVYAKDIKHNVAIDDAVFKPKK